jgi:transcriptional regulator with XRE-family HTH domain
MRKPFSNLVSKMPPDAQQRAKARTQQMLLEMNLQELRQNFTELTQSDIAELLNVTQAYVSKVERRGGDMLLSTLYQLVGALGGHVELRVQLPGREDVRLNQFDEMAKLAFIREELSKARGRKSSVPPR